MVLGILSDVPKYETGGRRRDLSRGEWESEIRVVNLRNPGIVYDKRDRLYKKRVCGWVENIVKELFRIR